MKGRNLAFSLVMLLLLVALLVPAAFAATDLPAARAGASSFGIETTDPGAWCIQVICPDGEGVSCGCNGGSSVD